MTTHERNRHTSIDAQIKFSCIIILIDVQLTVVHLLNGLIDKGYCSPAHECL